ncbi:hypothetical protein PVAR5_8059 [Paecilomyces variotii No. 5]|uniref:Uncharacterized protein n=1 Tax=Byssochlamys spectabilis (strain No. 5 / NBRC 109023) TaxID=1356009 RepID=V5FMW7_BYSSN|nr:hypothetical protein PVAR5_8059 [Paecilomyces variotii No. 5]
MSAPSAKRLRLDSDDGITGHTSGSLASASHLEINQLVYNLSEDDCRELLSQAASTHSDVLLSIRRVSKRHELEAAMTVHDFDWHSKAIWRYVNINYRQMSGSAQYDIAARVEDSIIDSINEICDLAATPMASFGTERSGLEVLRKIAKSIVLSSDTLGNEVQNRFHWDGTLVEGMKNIVEAMRPDQHEAMCFWDDGRGPWRNKLDELIRLSSQVCCFEGLDDVRYMLVGDEEWSEEEEEESGGSHSQYSDGDETGDEEDENGTTE